VFLVALLVTLAMGCSFEPSYQYRYDQEKIISNVGSLVTTTYRLVDAFAGCSLFDFTYLSLQIFNIYAFFVFWNSAKLVMESGILDDPERQMVCRRYEPYLSGIRWVSEHIQ
jgi:hypothetical protein